jgi:RNA polymerase subunit RPABC4/transcription elongation factor Spt4
MKKKECPSCAMNVDADSTVCPICSYEFTDTNKGGLKWVAIVLAILLLVYLILGVIL